MSSFPGELNTDTEQPSLEGECGWGSTAGWTPHTDCLEELKSIGREVCTRGEWHSTGLPTGWRVLPRLSWTPEGCCSTASMSHGLAVSRHVVNSWSHDLEHSSLNINVSSHDLSGGLASTPDTPLMAAQDNAEGEEEGPLRGEEGILRGEEGPLRGEEGILRGEDGPLRGEEGILRGEEGILRGDEGILRGEEGTLRGEEGLLPAGVKVPHIPFTGPPSSPSSDVLLSMRIGLLIRPRPSCGAGLMFRPRPSCGAGLTFRPSGGAGLMVRTHPSEGIGQSVMPHSRGATAHLMTSLPSMEAIGSCSAGCVIPTHCVLPRTEVAWELICTKLRGASRTGDPWEGMAGDPWEGMAGDPWEGVAGSLWEGVAGSL